MFNIQKRDEYHVVCIAKDESAYLHEWIFHHLHFGFDKLYIYLNRITDDSVALLEKISKKYPGVIFETIDWVDWCQPQVKKSIQNIVYSYHFSKVRRFPNSVYTLFIDVDEYWTPIDFSSTIKAEHEAIGKPAMASYEWLLESGKKQKFSPLESPLSYRYCSLVKSLYKNDLTPNLFSVHKMLVQGGYQGVMADGNAYVAHDIRKQGRVREDHANVKRSFVIHRVMKSEEEYLSSLVRSTASSYASIKLNRHGFYAAKASDARLVFPDKSIARYKKGLDDFINECGVRDMLSLARATHQARIGKLLIEVYKMGSEFDAKINSVFRNVNNKSIRLLLKYRREKDQKAKSRDSMLFEYLRDIAVSIEKVDMVSAHFFMTEAAKLNPNGPFIKNKLSRYAASLSS